MLSQRKEIGHDENALATSLEALQARLSEASPNTRRQTKKILEELESLQKGNSFDQFSYWYYLTFCTGYGYVVRASNGMQTRDGWLSPYKVREHLGGGSNAPHYLAVKPGSGSTLWAAIDIDEGSRYHPASEVGEGIEPILTAAANIGLTEPIWIQSSTSKGIHLWFPLMVPCETWQLAVGLEETMRQAGLEVRDGVLELRPNKKAYNSSYKALRAPLTGEGNSIWIEDYDLVDEPNMLWAEWRRVMPANRYRRLQEVHRSTPVYSSNRRGQKHKTGALTRAKERVSQGFTGRGQSQEMKLACLQVVRLLEGYEKPEEIRNRVLKLLTDAPGYEQYCGHQKAIRSGQYLTKGEINKARSLAPGGYANIWKEKENKKRHNDARNRAMQAMQEINDQGRRFTSLSGAFEFAKSIGAPSKSWWHKKENDDLLSLLKKTLGSERP